MLKLLNSGRYYLLLKYIYIYYKNYNKSSSVTTNRNHFRCLDTKGLIGYMLTQWSDASAAYIATLLWCPDWASVSKVGALALLNLYEVGLDFVTAWCLRVPKEQSQELQGSFCLGFQTACCYFYHVLFAKINNKSSSDSRGRETGARWEEQQNIAAMFSINCIMWCALATGTMKNASN